MKVTSKGKEYSYDRTKYTVKKNDKLIDRLTELCAMNRAELEAELQKAATEQERSIIKYYLLVAR